VKVKGELQYAGVKELPNLNDHIKVQQVDKILANFKLSDKELSLPGGGVLTSVYTKLALKGL